MIYSPVHTHVKETQNPVYDNMKLKVNRKQTKKHCVKSQRRIWQPMRSPCCELVPRSGAAVISKARQQRAEGGNMAHFGTGAKKHTATPIKAPDKKLLINPLPCPTAAARPRVKHFKWGAARVFLSRSQRKSARADAKVQSLSHCVCVRERREALWSGWCCCCC